MKKHFSLFYILILILNNLYPESIDRYLKKAEIYFDEGKYSDAIAILDEAVKIDPDDKRSYLYMANIYRIINDTDNAFKYVSLLLEKDSKYAEAYIARGDIFLKLGEMDKALEDLTLAINMIWNLPR